MPEAVAEELVVHGALQRQVEPVAGGELGHERVVAHDHGLVAAGSDYNSNDDDDDNHNKVSSLLVVVVVSSGMSE